MQTNANNIHIKDLESMTFPIQYKDEVKMIYRLGFEKGRSYIPRSDIIKGWVCAAIIVFLIVVITWNIAKQPTSEQAPRTTTETLKSSDINTICCLIQEYEAAKGKLSEYRKVIIVSELLSAKPSEWSAIVKKIGDEAPTTAKQRVQSTSYGGKQN